jgi:hypothetical protein
MRHHLESSIESGIRISIGEGANKELRDWSRLRIRDWKHERHPEHGSGRPFYVRSAQ